MREVGVSLGCGRRTSRECILGCGRRTSWKVAGALSGCRR